MTDEKLYKLMVWNAETMEELFEYPASCSVEEMLESKFGPNHGVKYAVGVELNEPAFSETLAKSRREERTVFWLMIAAFVLMVVEIGVLSVPVSFWIAALIPSLLLGTIVLLVRQKLFQKFVFDLLDVKAFEEL